jgi:release factor glutamine methyltransferase
VTSPGSGPKKAGRRYPSFFRRAARRIGRRWLAWRFRHFDPDNEPEGDTSVAGLRLRVLPGVFNPALHFTSSVFARYLKECGLISAGRSVLDMGTGSGVLAIASALSGAGAVVAVDINPAAVRCARFNVRRYGLDRVIEVWEGDMFEAVAGGRFDVVLCNPPYLRGEPQSVAGYAYWGGANLEWLERFGSELGRYLRPGGAGLLSIGDAAELIEITAILSRYGWEVEEVARKDLLFEIIHLFRLTKAGGGGDVENATTAF